MEQRLSLVTLGVANVGRSRRFYESLGWRASSVGGDEVAFFQLGGIALGLYGRAALAADARLPDDGNGAGGFGGVALAHNVRTREAVDTLLSEVAAAGGRILKPAEDAFWGGYSGYFADPDGHPWEVAWNPGFEIAADGSIRLPE
jgi:uncharacterized protein